MIERLARPATARLAVLAAILVYAALRTGLAYVDHPLISIDGAFQTHAALSGFASGGALGRDFQSYLGVTLMLALLPAFALLGGTLLASTAAATLAIFAGLAATLHALLRPMRWWTPARRRLLLAIAFALVASQLVPHLAPLAQPGASLRPLRWALPFLLFPLVLALLRRAVAGSGAKPAFALGLIGGAALLWSNDSGIPAFLSLAGALLLALWGRAGLSGAVAAFLGGALLAAGGIVLAVTHGDPAPWLAYNFGAVAGDQSWYFGPWDEGDRLRGPADLARLLLVDPVQGAALVSLLLCGLAGIVRRLRGRGAPAMTAAILFLAGSSVGTALLPQIGGHVGAEYGAGLILPGLALPLALFGRRLIPLYRRIAPVFDPRLLAPAAALAMGALIAAQALAVFERRPSATGALHVPDLGLYVPAADAPALAAMRALGRQWDAAGRPADRRLLSTYTSALDIAAGAAPPTRYASLIHALGPDGRRDFARAAEAGLAPLATTIVPDYSGWAEWNLRAGWPFHRALLAHYRPVARGTQHVLWARRPAPVPPPAAACALRPLEGGGVEVRVDPGRPGRFLADVRVARAASPGRAVLVAEERDTPLTRAGGAPPWAGFPRYGVPPEGELALGVALEEGRPSAVALFHLGRSRPVAAAGCAATLYPAPDFTALPPIQPPPRT